MSSAGYSQINKGSRLFGTDLNFNISNNKYSYDHNSASKSSGQYVHISPGFGYFIANNLALGVSSGYSFSKTKSTSGYPNGNNIFSNYSSHQFSLMPFIRYYKPLGEKFAAFLQANAGYKYGTGKSTSTHQGAANISSSSAGNSQALQTNLMMGFTYFVSNKFALETSLKSAEYTIAYNKSNSQDDMGNAYESVTKNVDYNYGLNLKMSTINFGVKYFIRKV